MPALTRARIFAVAGALAAAACGAPKPKVEVAPGADLGRYKRMGVLPFQDPSGRGRDVAETVVRALWKFGYGTVDVGTMKNAFDSLNIQPAAELSMHDLHEIRRVTHADALVFGSIDSPKGDAPRKLSLLLLDAESGDMIAQGSYLVPHDQEGGLEGAAEDIVVRIRREITLERTGIKRTDDDEELPWD